MIQVLIFIVMLVIGHIWLYPRLKNQYIKHKFKRSIKKVCKEKGYIVRDINIQIID